MDEIIETAKREGNLHWFVSIMTQMKVKRDVSNISDVVILIQWTNEFSTTLLGGNTCKKSYNNYHDEKDKVIITVVLIMIIVFRLHWQK